jgi:hypothetical protein
VAVKSCAVPAAVLADKTHALAVPPAGVKLQPILYPLIALAGNALPSV